jgi:hypothetical protein
MVMNASAFDFRAVALAGGIVDGQQDAVLCHDHRDGDTQNGGYVITAV